MEWRQGDIQGHHHHCITLRRGLSKEEQEAEESKRRERRERREAERREWEEAERVVKEEESQMWNEMVRRKGRGRQSAMSDFGGRWEGRKAKVLEQAMARTGMAGDARSTRHDPTALIDTIFKPRVR